MTTVRVPPGRAGRLHLRRKLTTAERGAGLLERKLHALLPQQQARRRAAEESLRAWREAAAEADAWLGRALAAVGDDGLRLALPGAAAGVSVRAASSMGVRYPDEVVCDLPGELPEADPGSAALVCARTAHVRAVRAAAQAAVDQGALRALDAAVTTTRRQIRVLRRHWIPALRAAHERLEFVLEQSDFEDGVRRRHAASRSSRA
ncbi:hypothetical protein KGA66_22785 [Actinocrinis puniceicyclus]|uniref:V-type ATPase, D subunit n=1 Tax=Actinocrinis puniceicyclus TaxID=977794 RepID=A0A8J7WNY8_9ACTN|nr:V-type ATP synthase subunit D [Actinocrinis puniceicyclus]MBS2965893.1 hypothetical protein [Actinocrinis puniceicyclus]